jgi:hypothetical protein
MKLNKLLELDRKNLNQEALAQSFGDHFLYQHNSIFRKIRQLTLKAGCKYSVEFNLAYTALPLGQLDYILLKQEIPYFNNVSVLQEIEKKIPQTTDWDEVSDNLKRNYLFHESCHVVARSISQSFFTSAQTSSHQVLKLLLEESFANSCELLGIADVDQTAHRLFYEAQSYIFMFDERHLIQELIRDWNLEFVLKFMIYSYLFSNFLKNKIEDTEMNKIFQLILNPKDERTKLFKDAKQIKKLRAISQIAFELNPRFRMVTTGFYLRLCGFKKDSIQFNFLKLIESEPDFKKLIHEMVLRISGSI